MTFRSERDPLGELNVPGDAYYDDDVQTARAVDNFPISNLQVPADLITVTILIRKAAAEADRDRGRPDPTVAHAIVSAVEDILAGKMRDQFVVDVCQARAGTSHNMNNGEAGQARGAGKK